MRVMCSLLTLILVFCATTHANEGWTMLDGELHHLRIDGPREWTEFPEQSEGDHLETSFSSKKNEAAWTLRLRQQDVKQSWTVLLNAKSLGRLVRDEDDMVVYFEVPSGVLVNGKNVLRIEQGGRGDKTPDDIRVGEIYLDRRPLSVVL
ncbi:MAG: hypothetical protein IID32_06340, partial [Planctomycetes bacterium]|nr:hypothetical protein [Planctomycetota bacterium]